MCLSTCNYSVPGQPTSAIHVFQIDGHKSGVLPFRTISCDTVNPPMNILTSINCDFQIGGENTVPKIMAFTQNSENMYEFDLNLGTTETKVIKVGMKNLRSLKYFENCLLGIDAKLQVIELTKL